VFLYNIKVNAIIGEKIVAVIIAADAITRIASRSVVVAWFISNIF
jgi:hypothetical protein